MIHIISKPRLVGNDCIQWMTIDCKVHREDGPAIEDYCGDMYWFFEGERHRLDGPAVDLVYGGAKEWWFHGKQINCSSQEEFERLIKLKAFW